MVLWCEYHDGSLMDHGSFVLEYGRGGKFVRDRETQIHTPIGAAEMTLGVACTRKDMYALRDQIATLHNFTLRLMLDYLPN